MNGCQVLAGPQSLEPVQCARLEARSKPSSADGRQPAGEHIPFVNLASGNRARPSRIPRIRARVSPTPTRTATHSQRLAGTMRACKKNLHDNFQVSTTFTTSAVNGNRHLSAITLESSKLLLNVLGAYRRLHGPLFTCEGDA